MYLCCLLPFLVTLAAVALADPSPVPAGWTLHRRAPPDTNLLVRISLVQSNLHNLDAYLLDVADPQSPNYGQHWTLAKVLDTFRPRQESVDVVTSWLAEELGLSSHSPGLSLSGDVINLNTTAAEAERIFDTEYNVYRSNNDGSERIGCHEGHNFPPHVSDHVDFVWPTLLHGKRRLAARAHTLPSSSHRQPREAPLNESSICRGSRWSACGDLRRCDEAVTLECLRALYCFDYTPLAPHKNTVGVAEFGMNFYRPQDLDTFFQKFAPSRFGQRPKLVSIAGGHLNHSDTSRADLDEASLDLQLMMGLLGHEQEVLLYQTDTTIFDPLIADKLLGAWDASYCAAPGVADQNLTDCGNAPRANVLSISYAAAPDILDPLFSPVLRRECQELGKLSLLGSTFVASSGDVGVAWRTLDGSSTQCLVNGSLISGSSGAFIGAFPASCPYVTAVGGTQISHGKSVYDVETAASDSKNGFFSGGGFSNNFPRPSFQQTAVTKYLERFAPPYGPNVFNRSGRAFPDVSANGGPIEVVVDGNFTTVGGTSASAPIFASIIAAINDHRVAAGKSPVGWINPALYSSRFARSFNDVTTGSNPGCGTRGFPAAPGWDPVTGLGTPNFERLLENFLSLP